MKRVSGKVEAFELTTDELLKRMSKGQAIISYKAFCVGWKSHWTTLSSRAKIRLEKVLEALKRS